MARKPRIQYWGAFYHVIARGNRKQNFFLDEQDYNRYLSYLSDYQERFNFTLYAYVLMMNHVHLLIQIKEVSLSKIMQGLQLRYTQYFNKKYREVGHLFQGRYKAILCDRETYLLELVRYIHLNPVRSGMVKDPREYPWSSHRIYMGEAKGSFVEQGVVLSQFGEQKTKAQRRYEQFILEGIDIGHRQEYYQVTDQRYLGSDQFIEEVKDRVKEEGQEVLEIPLEEIIELVCYNAGIKKEILYSRSRNRRAAEARGIIAYLARNLAGYKVKEIAQCFNREPMTISFSLSRLENILTKDTERRAFISDLQESLSRERKIKYFITNA